MNPIFGSDSKLMYYLNKVGQIIILNVYFIIGCLPIFTIGTSITAFYYAMIKAVRRERSYPTTEFWQSYLRNLVNGILFTVSILAAFVLGYLNREYVASQTTQAAPVLVVIYDILFVLLGLLISFLFPVMSRFSLKRTTLLRMAIEMSIRHLPYTIALIAGTVFSGMLLLWVLPIPFLLILPGAWCYISTFLVEPVLKKYMGKPQEGEDAWYYE